MRYYAIDLFYDNVPRTLDVLPKTGHTFSSHNGSTLLPGALNVEFDIPSAQYATTGQGTRFRIWGLPKQYLAVDYTGWTFKIYGGMAKGLPLATQQNSRINPTANPLAQGTIQTSFGNWTGTNMSLDFIGAAIGGFPQSQFNVQFIWPKGTKLSNAIQSALKPLGSTFKYLIKISAQLTSPADNFGATRLTSITELANHIKDLSMSPPFPQKITSTTGTGYTGITTVPQADGSVLFYDNSVDATTLGNVTTPSSPQTAGSFANPIQIDFTDLIGQPTLLNTNLVSVTTILRSDLQVGNWFRLPVTNPLFTNTIAPSSGTPNIQSYTTILSGKFSVSRIHHFANFRQGDGSSWITSIQGSAEANTSGQNPSTNSTGPTVSNVMPSS